MVLLGGLATYIDPKSSPARVGMGITTVLTISTVIQGLKSQLPAVNYLTALDVYLWACFFFVSVTLIEYAYLNYQTVVLPRYKNEERMNLRDLLKDERDLFLKENFLEGWDKFEAERDFMRNFQLADYLGGVYTYPSKTLLSANAEKNNENSTSAASRLSVPGNIEDLRGNGAYQMNSEFNDENSQTSQGVDQQRNDRQSLPKQKLTANCSGDSEQDRFSNGSRCPAVPPYRDSPNSRELLIRQNQRFSSSTTIPERKSQYEVSEIDNCQLFQSNFIF